MASDSFSVFLESIKSASPSRSADGGKVNPHTAGKIIEALQKSPSGSDVSQLAKLADVDFFDFAAALQTLQRLGAVIVEGQGSTQYARLGDNWQSVLSLLTAQ
ncbi:MAG TPA: hypothetical protein VHY33_02365 [Thermoanaerobaculia bacterium]|jgi:DNA-binding IclR family transcriptional regulator|nr:hypothetical protein [Thermoanaerobaculia bacterium]